MTRNNLEIEKLLIDLMRQPKAVGEERIDSLNEEDWAYLEGLADEYRCGPYLSAMLAERASPIARKALDQLSHQSTFRSLEIAKECVDIHRMLNDVGIKHLFLKGVPLSFRDYPEPRMRPMRDVDLLVAEKDAQRASGLLSDAGGKIEFFSDMRSTPHEQGKHLPPVCSPGDVLPVEIHYRVLSPQVSLSQRALEQIETVIWDAVEFVQAGNAQLPVPATEMLLLHVIIHGVLDHEFNNGPLFITDIIHLLANKQFNLSRFQALVDETGAHHAVEVAAGLLSPSLQRSLMGHKTQHQFLTDDAVALLLLQPSEARYQVKTLATLSSLPMRQKVALIMTRVFPDMSTMRSRWRTEGRVSGAEPKSRLLLWFWFVTTRLRGLFRSRSTFLGPTRASLMALRRELAERSR